MDGPILREQIADESDVAAYLSSGHQLATWFCGERRKHGVRLRCAWNGRDDGLKV